MKRKLLNATLLSLSFLVSCGGSQTSSFSENIISSEEIILSEEISSITQKVYEKAPKNEKLTYCNT